jgi:hypothetical protein
MEVAQQIDAQQRILRILADNGVPQPDDVTRCDSEVRLLWHDRKVAVVIELDPEGPDEPDQPVF